MEMSDSISIAKLIRVIRQLPSDAPRDWPGKWYKTQKQHWLRWLGEYHGPGAYGRRTGMQRDARYAYNHIVEPEMLLWLIEAADIPAGIAAAAKRASRRGTTMQEKSAAIRRHAAWEVLENALWGKNTGRSQIGRRKPGKPKDTVPRLVLNIHRKFFADILAIPARKRVEYRDMSDYWLLRVERAGPAPFNLRLLNGMLPPVPEAIVRVNKVAFNKKTKEIELYLGRVLQTKHWDRVREMPPR